jgi:hypothetical protein
MDNKRYQNDPCPNKTGNEAANIRYRKATTSEELAVIASAR